MKASMHTTGFGKGGSDRLGVSAGHTEYTRQASLLKTGALQDAIFNSAYFSSIATTYIRHNGSRFPAIVSVTALRNILDLSKVEAGMMALELEAVDLPSLLQNSLTIVRETAAAQHIRLEPDLGEGLGIVQLDVRKTKQIVYNLLSNAVKFSASDGSVQLRARRVQRNVVGIVEGDWPMHRFPLADNEYNVSDHGIGISHDNMGRLFQAFSQIDSSLARKFEGTGLGLAMVKQLAELQGGAVAVTSAEGKGSRFAVWLPLRAPPHGADPA